MSAPTESCPECGTDVRQISTETVRNMVEPFENQDVDDAQYPICKTQDCPAVYFADELDQQFETDVIRVRANFKLNADADPYPLCYCFGYDKQHVRENIADDDETNIDEWITERVQTEECACRWKSLLGACCLGNVREATGEAKAEIAD